jgi:hypothetical protein
MDILPQDTMHVIILRIYTGRNERTGLAGNRPRSPGFKSRIGEGLVS